MEVLIIVQYIFSAIFFLWVTKWGGAERLEGSFSSLFLINTFANTWTADGIKFWVTAWFTVDTIYTLYNVLNI